MTTPKINSMKLIARWNRGQDPALDAPTDIRWDNGQCATLTDYIHHLDDTFVFTVQGGGFVRIAFPDVVADVQFDEDMGHWVCQPPGQQRILLELSNPNVGDDQIIAELYTYPIVYRAIIHRKGFTSRVKEPSCSDFIRPKEEALG